MSLNELIYHNAKQMVELYYFLNCNPTLAEQILNIVALGGAQFIIGTELEEAIAVALAVSGGTAALIAAGAFIALDIVILLFVPTLSERIQDACGGTIMDVDGIKTIICTYEIKITNENYANMQRYTSSIYEGAVRERGTWYPAFD